MVGRLKVALTVSFSVTTSCGKRGDAAESCGKSGLALPAPERVDSAGIVARGSIALLLDLLPVLLAEDRLKVAFTLFPDDDVYSSCEFECCRPFLLDFLTPSSLRRSDPL